MIIVNCKCQDISVYYTSAVNTVSWLAESRSRVGLQNWLSPSKGTIWPLLRSDSTFTKDSSQSWSAFLSSGAHPLATGVTCIVWRKWVSREPEYRILRAAFDTVWLVACCDWPPKARGAQMPRFRQTTNNIIGKMVAADDVPRFDIILSDIFCNVN